MHTYRPTPSHTYRCEPQWTTCHARYMGTVDYVWYSPHCHSAAASACQGAGEEGRGLRAGAGAKAEAVPQAVLPAAAVSLRAVQALLPPDARYLPRGIPSPGLPSDHISLLCDFQFFGR